MVKGIGHTAFVVKDMDTTVAFYEKTLGFNKIFDIPRPETGEPWIEYLYAGGNQFIELFYGGTDEDPFRDERIGFFHLCLEVEDVHEAWKKVKETGAPMDDAPKQGADGNWQCWTHDPDGIKIELMQYCDESLQMKYLKQKG